MSFGTEGAARLPDRGAEVSKGRSRPHLWLKARTVPEKGLSNGHPVGAWGTLVAHHRTQRRFYVVRVTDRLHQMLGGCRAFGFGHRRDHFDLSHRLARGFTPARYRQVQRELGWRSLCRHETPELLALSFKLPGILKARWPEIEHQLLQGRYQPQPVRRVQIPKPAGGTRDLGIPTVIDRVIQQAVLQRLQPLWDPTFSEHSYGFRLGRSAQQAVAQAQAYVTEGHQFVVDIDLAKFFDRVNHDKLMARVAARIPDRRVLRLIRSYMTAGVLNNGLFETSREGTPQGGPLSPLLSNLVLDELDCELEHRGHCFVRYADDCNVYVRSEKAGHRVMASLTRFIEGRLKLQVNAQKSAVPDDPQPRRRIADKAVARFKDRVPDTALSRGRPRRLAADAPAVRVRPTPGRSQPTGGTIRAIPRCHRSR